MSFLKSTLRFFHHQFLKLSWLALLLVLLGHFILSWALMWLASESALLPFDQWFYFYVTTSTTVGYGDLSPGSALGRVWAALFILPGGVVLLAAVLGKLSSFFMTVWRRGMQGRGDYSGLKNHIVIFGWNRNHTPKMVALIFGDSRRENRKVLLCTSQEMENPFPEQVLFVRGESLTDPTFMQRTGIDNAARVIVFRDSDDQTLATCLGIAATKTTAHIVAWFENQQMVDLLHSHCPQIECHSNISMELLVRSAQDPGSSRVQQQLLSTLIGPTQYSVRVPEDFGGTTFGRLLEFFKVHYEAIALGVAESTTGNDLRLNPPGNDRVEAGQVVYYLSAQRIHGNEIHWDQI
ncbi:potassium channel family protein [Endozoicomonas sp. SCSIO W0465]|uniref:potassium channel family protein n=1 Tax=Endozoicomonas sp. SCSIO W0465 TaxID=2918516 RepID=UPI002075EE3D|nr:potassium channel family protein [Endozoicomonas sp. SCSIO W0465]USE39269.1 ion channel [Endozoicomonas sp. SCSIO W0465]